MLTVRRFCKAKKRGSKTPNTTTSANIRNGRTPARDNMRFKNTLSARTPALAPAQPISLCSETNRMLRSIHFLPEVMVQDQIFSDITACKFSHEPSSAEHKNAVAEIQNLS